eukprot:scaffold3068_cov401-Prasinococcus_capsulatus_cf.AAC.17
MPQALALRSSWSGFLISYLCAYAKFGCQLTGFSARMRGPLQPRQLLTFTLAEICALNFPEAVTSSTDATSSPTLAEQPQPQNQTAQGSRPASNRLIVPPTTSFLVLVTGVGLEAMGPARRNASLRPRRAHKRT